MSVLLCFWCDRSLGENMNPNFEGGVCWLVQTFLVQEAPPAPFVHPPACIMYLSIYTRVHSCAQTYLHTNQHRHMLTSHTQTHTLSTGDRWHRAYVGDAATTEVILLPQPPYLILQGNLCKARTQRLKLCLTTPASPDVEVNRGAFLCTWAHRFQTKKNKTKRKTHLSYLKTLVCVLFLL